jgi:acyl carrier protein
MDMRNGEAGNRLLEYLHSAGFSVDGDIQADTPLLDSGLLDSLGLFKLALWIEEELGAPLDLGEVDAVRDWNTVDQIAAFIQTQRTQV